MESGRNGKSGEYRRKSSGILFQITALVVIVALISGGVSLIIFSRSQNRMIEKSKNKLVETEAEVIASSHVFVPNIVSRTREALGIPEYTTEELAEAASSGEITPSQQAANDTLKSMVDTNFFKIDEVIEALPSSNENDNAVIVLSSNDKYMYKDLPEELAALVEEEGDSYELLKDGVPELGLEGEHLVTFRIDDSESSDSVLWYFDFKPMGEELAAVDAFYSKETSRINKVLGAVVGGSVLALIIITFFVLSLLIRKRIKEPIDELSAVAEEVMEGDLDVEVPVKRGEEFEGLKKTFNEMLGRINAVFMETAGESQAGEPKKTGAGGKKRKKRSRILIYTTCLIAIVFIISGVLSFVVFSQSQSRLIQKSKEYIVRRQATLVASAHHFFMPLLEHTYMAEEYMMGQIQTEEDIQNLLNQFIDSIRNKEMIPVVHDISEVLRDVVETGLYGAEVAITFLPPIPPLLPEPVAFMTSHDEFVFMDMPESLRKLAENEVTKDDGFSGRINDENTYKLFVDGIPELGLEGEILTILQVQTLKIPGSDLEITQWYFINVPMGEELAAVDAFYNDERNTALLRVGLVMVISLIVLIMISYFVLNLLIKKKITAPIDELSEAAVRVMKGDLDFEVRVRRGEEFEGLKRAFNEMLTTIRDIVGKAEN